MVAIRKILIIRAANQAMAFSIPTLAAVLSFVTYGSTQDSFDPVSGKCSMALKIQAVIFTSLALFNLLRQPLMFLPRALSTLTDAQTAIQRLDPVCPVFSACHP
jgi:ATP-binding cassette subfamily C (CFTR/MRP) protein 1